MSSRQLIQPNDIRDKALRQYSKFLSAWLSDSPFFPLTIPGIGVPDESLAVAQQQVQTLRHGSKEVLGYGYIIDWRERNSRHHGKNLFPERVLFESQGDFLRFIGKQREFSEFSSAVELIRSNEPRLESWLVKNRAVLMNHVERVDGLLAVTDYFQRHPRPGVFAREIPVAVDSKFIEQNSGVLEQWLNILLPPEAIRADERHFERRFGLRYAEPQLLFRFLDTELQRSTGCLWPECSVPLHSIAATPIAAAQVVIVENKVNLLTFPPVQAAIAMGGLGNGIVDLAYIPWLSDRILWYWGDLDVEGFEILSRLRIRFPQTRSFLMDAPTLTQWKDSLAVAGTARPRDVPVLLTESETAAFKFCVANNVRIEQERIPQAAVFQAADELVRQHCVPQSVNSPK